LWDRFIFMYENINNYVDLYGYRQMSFIRRLEVNVTKAEFRH